jgi:hypothetical protein
MIVNDVFVLLKIIELLEYVFDTFEVSDAYF